MTSRNVFLSLTAVFALSRTASSFQPRHGPRFRSRDAIIKLRADDLQSWPARREVLVSGLAAVSAAPFFFSSATVRAEAGKREPLPTDPDALATLVGDALRQLDAVPELIKSEKWDSIRVILITPPLSDCWTKGGRPLLKALASGIGDLPNGDEMAALEAREDGISHLQYLDMAAYNNNFSPVKSEGAAGSTKELVRAYYEMPKDELGLARRALSEMARLAKEAAQ